MNTPEFPVWNVAETMDWEGTRMFRFTPGVIPGMVKVWARFASGTVETHWPSLLDVMFTPVLFIMNSVPLVVPDTFAYVDGTDPGPVS